MLSTGYLTLAERYIPYEETKLRLPNEEIRHLFIEEVDNWFADMAESADRTPLFSAIWNGKDEELSKILTAYLRKTISYYDYSESYYHAFTAGLVASSGYRVMSNRESGNGRPDLIIADADTGKEIETETVTTTVEHWVVYTITYNGEAYFADEIFHLTDDQKQLADDLIAEIE